MTQPQPSAAPDGEARGWRTGPLQPGRALLIDRDGQMFVGRGYEIRKSPDGGRTWVRDCVVPAPFPRRLAMRSRLGARLFRYEIQAFRILDDGTRVAVARDGVYWAAPGQAVMVRSFRITRGSRPLNLGIHGRRVVFGEYGDGLRTVETRVYASEDAGRSFEVALALPRGSVRHIHNVMWDATADHWWLLVGDHGAEPGIAALSADFKTLEWLGRGHQKVRATQAIIQPDCLIYGTDSEQEPNYVVRFDKQSGRIDLLGEIEGSSQYAAVFGDVHLVSTCVESNPACPSREAALYASTDAVQWRRLFAHRKDRHHPKYFQFGTLVLPYALTPHPRGMYSGQAVEEADGRFALLDLSDFTPGPSGPTPSQGAQP
jgi:hypothetical protein